MPTKAQLAKAAAKTLAAVSSINTNFKTTRVRNERERYQESCFNSFVKGCKVLGIVVASFSLTEGTPPAAKAVTETTISKPTVYRGAKGGMYVEKVSQKTGNVYRKYLTLWDKV